MKKRVFFVFFLGLIILSTDDRALSAVYMEWSGIPSGEVRLKGYCVESEWTITVVFHTGETRNLSRNAISYINWIELPQHHICAEGDTVNPATWYPATDTVEPDNGMMWPIEFSVPLFYTTWDGISENRVRLKGYCVENAWYLYAIAANEASKVPLSSVAKNYLASLQIPEGSCVNDEAIGSAYWYPTEDIVRTDSGVTWPPKLSEMMMSPALMSALNVASSVGNGSIYDFNLPFHYDVWDGIPKGQIRLKKYCRDNRWTITVVIPTSRKSILSENAQDYLHWIDGERGACTNGDTVNPATWYPATDTVEPDNGMMWPIEFSVPLFYTTWDGISENRVRLKGYCVENAWYLYAIAANEASKVPLSSVAKNYLASLRIPSKSCTNGATIGSAYWYPKRDVVLRDN